jgi:hypothetical protein
LLAHFFLLLLLLLLLLQAMADFWWRHLVPAKLLLDADPSALDTVNRMYSPRWVGTQVGKKSFHQFKHCMAAPAAAYGNGQGRSG